MRKFAIILMLSLPIFASAQESPINSFYDKYSGKEGYTSVYITKYMFDLFKKISSETDDKEFQESINGINSIKILTIDSTTNITKKVRFIDELRTKLPKSIYKNLMIVKDGGNTITFMINEKESKISEFVMTINDTSSPVLIFLEGDINLKQISKLSKTMKIQGFKNLQKLDNKKTVKQNN